MKFCRATRKHCHTEGKAEAQLRSIRERDPNYCGEVYFCLHCGHFHIGRRRPQKGHQNKYRL
jgi:hypothetical protein